MTDQQLEARRRSTRRRVLAVGVLAPIAIAVVATLLMLSWLPELPDPIAVHWSGTGPDGFGPVMPMLLLPVGVVIAFSVFCAVFGLPGSRTGGITWTQKFLVVTSVWLSALLGVGITGSVAVQRGLADAREAPEVGLWFLAGAAAGIVLAAGAWFLLPKAEDAVSDGVDPAPLELHGTELVSWTNQARLGTPAIVVVSVAMVAGIVASALATVTSDGRAWPSFAIIVGVALLGATTFWFRVAADRRGLTVRGMLGWPRKRIALDDIRSVQVVAVNPVAEFGGWGWRWTVGGRSGIVLRVGEGIEVTQANGRRFVVTVDDAGTGAAVLAGLLARQAG